MKDFTKQRNILIKTECNAIKREMRDEYTRGNAREMNEKIAALVAKKYPPMTTTTALDIWSRRRYSNRPKHKKEAA